MLKLVGTSIDDATRPSLLQLLQNTVLSGVGGYFVLNFIGLILRTFRYHILIKATGEKNTPTILHLGAVTGVRNMMVDLLPARIGELIYVALLNRGYQVSASNCLSSLSIAVVFDFIALGTIILLSGLLLAIIGTSALWLWSTFLVVLILVSIAALGFTVILPKFNEFFSNYQFNNSILNGLQNFTTQLNQSVEACRKAGVFTSVFMLSFAIRSVKYGGLFLLFMAVASPAFPELSEASWEKILGALVGAEISASLPVPTLMSFGTYEAGGTLAFSALGFSEADSFLSLLGVHIWSQSIDYGLGLICFLVIILLFRSKSKSPSPLRNKLLVASIGMFFLIGCFLLALQYRNNLKLGSSNAPPIGQSTLEENAQQLQTGLNGLSKSNVTGFVVWSSNRFGNHDILRMDLPSGEIQQVTNHSHTETWARISPDGKQLVFARSREPWVSQRNSVAWDVLIKDLDTNVETLISENASYPFWVRSNTIGFLKSGKSIQQYDISTGQFITSFEPGENNSVPVGAPLSSPDIHPVTNETVFTTRQSAINLNTGFWGTGLWDGVQEVQGVLDGCELNWSGDGSKLYQVGHGGKQKTMFYQIDPDTLVAEPLLDLSGEFSHEYWPEDSNDGRYLVFGASRGDHEHDTADYEIFLWEIGRPESDAFRLTFHSGNDNWPDIFIE